MRLGESFRESRKKYDVSATKVAQGSGVNYTNLLHWERGKTGFSVATLERLAAAARYSFVIGPDDCYVMDVPPEVSPQAHQGVR